MDLEEDLFLLRCLLTLVAVATPMVDQHSLIPSIVTPTMQLARSPTLALAVVLALIANVDMTRSQSE